MYDNLDCLVCDIKLSIYFTTSQRKSALMLPWLILNAVNVVLIVVIQLVALVNVLKSGSNFGIFIANMFLGEYTAQQVDI